MLAEVICKAVGYSFIVQDDIIIILKIQQWRKTLPEDLHIRARNKKMVHALLLVTKMTFIVLYNFLKASRTLAR